MCPHFWLPPAAAVKQPQIVELLTPVVAQFDLELDAVEIIPAGKRRLLRIVVDGDGPEGVGPLLDDIAAASHAISAVLDESPATGAQAYTLEVSSRGVGRPLELARHWRRNLTRLVEVSTSAGEKLTGRVVSVTDIAVRLEIKGRERELAFAEIAKALVQVELNRPTAHDEPLEGED